VRSRIRHVLLALAALALAAPAGAATTDAAATGRAHVPPPTLLDAPIGRKGGLVGSDVTCANPGVEPRVRWRVTRVETSRRWVRHYDSVPGRPLLRVPPGTYRSRTAVTCGRSRVVRRHVLVVERKTPEGTVSRAEFDAVQLGMTRAQMAAVLGLEGSCTTDGGITTCQFDQMALWPWVLITLEGDVVIAKDWNVGHD
jgi:hypothetical protein